MTCHTERESNRGRCDAIVIDRVTLDLQDALTILTRDASAGLGHAPRDQYAGGLADERPIRRVEGIEMRESSISATANLCLGSGKACATGQKA